MDPGRTSVELAEQIAKIADLLRTELMIPGTDLTHSLATARSLRQLTDEALASLVASARDRGVAWQVIGDALGTSRQAAFQRFGTPVDPRTGRMMDRQTLPEADERAVRLLDQIAGQRWAEAAADFGPVLTENLGSQGLADAYAQLIAIGGVLEAQDPPQVVAMAGVTVVEIVLHHEAADFLGRVSFAADGKVVGLWFLPADRSSRDGSDGVADR